MVRVVERVGDGLRVEEPAHEEQAEGETEGHRPSEWYAHDTILSKKNTASYDEASSPVKAIGFQAGGARASSSC